MAEAPRTASNPPKKSKLRANFGRETIVKQFRQSVSNTKRRNRRKRSKSKYYRSLKRRRITRNTDDLCSDVKTFAITDMEWAPTCSLGDLPIEVAEWHKQDQIAFWKSRAISLEIENRMLHRHLRDVYAKQIEDKDWQQSSLPSTSKEPIESKKVDQMERITPKVPEGKKRLEEMKEIYGDNAEKIMGMETAVQLNYERHVEKSNASYWPNLPIKL